MELLGDCPSPMVFCPSPSCPHLLVLFPIYSIQQHQVLLTVHPTCRAVSVLGHWSLLLPLPGTLYPRNIHGFLFSSSILCSCEPFSSNSFLTIHLRILILHLYQPPLPYNVHLHPTGHHLTLYYNFII